MTYSFRAFSDCNFISGTGPINPPSVSVPVLTIVNYDNVHVHIGK